MEKAFAGYRVGGMVTGLFEDRRVKEGIWKVQKGKGGTGFFGRDEWKKAFGVLKRGTMLFG